MRREVVVLVFVALLSAPLVAQGATGAFFDRHLERLVASPTPVGAVRVASDEGSWRVDVPVHAIVAIEARSDPSTPFALRAGPYGAGQSAFVLPTTHAGFILSEPGAWRVSVDPLAGVSIDIRVTFRGHVSDVNGAPAAFTLTDLGIAPGCVVPEVCLP